MTNDQFYLAAAQTKLRAASIDAARMVLVNGHSYKHASNVAKINRSKIREYCHRIRSVHRGIIGCPQGWVVLSVCVPADNIDEILHVERKARRDYDF